MDLQEVFEKCKIINLLNYKGFCTLLVPRFPYLNTISGKYHNSKYPMIKKMFIFQN